MNRIISIIMNKGSSIAFALIGFIFTIVPENVFGIGFIPCNWSDSTIIIVNRIITSLAIFVIVNLIYQLYIRKRRYVILEDRNIRIKIEYGDLFSYENGLKVISFDECFNTTVGDRPQDIKAKSVCGQYLIKYPIDNMQELIECAGIQSNGQSRFNRLPKYKSGLIIPRDNFLLMSFTRLNQQGLGEMTYTQYLECLRTLWEQIDIYHGTKDVYVPVLGSQIVRFDRDLTQQELLDIMISSYRLSPKRLRRPYTLHIVCRKRDGFSINDVFGL